MNYSSFVNLLFELVIIILLVRILMVTSRNNRFKKKLKLNCILDTIFTRTSIRRYKDRAVNDETIKLILRSAMSAPSAVNKQPWKFIVVTDKQLLNVLAQGLPYAEMTSKASLAIVACGDMQKALKNEEKDFWIQDVSAASQNILLACHGLKLGAVWTGVYPLAERVEYIQGILNLPPHIIPLNIIPIGYPAESHPYKNKWNEDNVIFNKWKS